MDCCDLETASFSLCRLLSAVLIVTAVSFISCIERSPPEPPSDSDDQFDVGEQPENQDSCSEPGTFPDDQPCLSEQLVVDGVDDVTPTGATVEGTFGEPPGDSPEEHGFCWSHDDLPTLDDSCTFFGQLHEQRTTDHRIEGLEPGRGYRVRSFVSDDDAVQYSENSIEFTTDAPGVTDLTASRGTHDEGVELEWTETEGAVAYQIRRDGSDLATIDAEVPYYLDTNAEATDASGPPQNLRADGDGKDAVEVTWEPPGLSDAQRHDYTVVAIYPDTEAAESDPEEGFRGSSELAGYAVEIDELQWISVDSALRYEDHDATAPTIDPGVASATRGVYEDRVELSVEATDVSPGEPSSYRVRAIYTDGSEEIAGPVEGRRTAGEPDFQWQRSDTENGVAFSNIPGAESTTYDDENAPSDGSQRHYRMVVDADGAPEQTTEAVIGYRAVAPELATYQPIFVGSQHVELEGEILTRAVPRSHEHGFCVDTSPAPQLDEATCMELGEPLADLFSATVRDLTEETTYHARTFATHETVGTVYGDEITFTTDELSCESGTVTGSTCLPDASAWPGAQVKISGVDCDGNSFTRTALSDRFGNYELTDVPAGIHQVTARSGSFDGPETEAIAIPNTNNSADDDLCLQGDEASIALLEGTFDDLRGFLDDVQFEYDLYESTSDPDSDTAGLVDDLVTDSDAIDDYDIIIVECGTTSINGLSDPDAATDVIRQFVEDNNSLYASDMRHDYIEAPFDDVELETSNASGNQSVTGSVVDVALQTVLDTDTVDVWFQSGGWQFVTDFNPELDSQLDANSVSAGSDTVDGSLILNYPVPDTDGQLVYTSMHHDGYQTDDMEDVIRYLLFQL